MCQNRVSGILLRDVKMIVEIGHIFRLQEEVVNYLGYSERSDGLLKFAVNDSSYVMIRHHPKYLG